MKYVIARMQSENDAEVYQHYIAMCLYAISNQSKMTKTFSDILKSVNTPPDNRSGKEVAEEAAAKMGIKINWQK